MRNRGWTRQSDSRFCSPPSLKEVDTSFDCLKLATPVVLAHVANARFMEKNADPRSVPACVKLRATLRTAS